MTNQYTVNTEANRNAIANNLYRKDYKDLSTYLKKKIDLIVPNLIKK